MVTALTLAEAGCVFGGGVLTGALAALYGLARAGRHRRGRLERQVALAALTDALGHVDAGPEGSGAKEGPCGS